ncbi:MAG: magnesium transporter [Halieaceae bacterium MED-G27]|jgi:magnesium transporter|nr:magnesium transporter [Halieaceae bacterium]OUT65710.1 MAG: magnesium transporter [Cellvibrionales bacterium TMED21]PDH35720.1 MAG: magnesium transporter [Halieaceae bacterium MED-G27]|tara:strand:+ start:20018 stop:21367 length:1350 start_codon:yes stop_codon:yes gene_type:complete
MVDINKLESLSLSRVDAALRSGTNQDVASLLADMEPGDVAHLINASPPETRDIIWPLLESEQEADVLNELPDDLRNQFLSDLQPEAVASIVRQLDDDDVADILHELPATLTDDVLQALTDSDRARLTATLDFPDDVAGGLMSTDVLTIRADLTLDVVLRYLRRHIELPENTDSLMVTNREGHYVGLLPIRTLLVSDPHVSVREMMATEREPLDVMTPDDEVARRFERNDWISAPVIDAEGKLLGRITIDDVVDVIREEADHSLAVMAGLGEGDTFARVAQTAPRRTVWLAVNLVTAILAAAVISAFQGTIEQVVALAVLMPIVASMGGIAGTQSLTVLIRAMAMGQVNNRTELWLVRREVLVAVLNGLLWSVVIAAMAVFWFDDLILGGIIAAAIMINLLTAGLAGAALPIVLERLDVDPALAGGVVLTTITDVVGFFAFLGLAAYFYG